MTTATKDAKAETPNLLGASPMTRREFLYYIWGASMALFMAQGAGLTLWFAYPRFREGEFGGVIRVPVGNVPAPDSEPFDVAEGRFFLVNIGDVQANDSRMSEAAGDFPQTKGVKAIYKVCVHLGCIYKWITVNDRYECPCHGSKYLANGVTIAGPAARNLDTFVIRAVDANGNVLAQTEPVRGNLDGGAIEIPAGTVVLEVDTGSRINGAVNAPPIGG